VYYFFDLKIKKRINFYTVMVGGDEERQKSKDFRINQTSRVPPGSESEADNEQNLCSNLLQ